MATINDATRMCKRIILTNLLTNDYSIALTPLLSGKHGIGKSQVAKRIAKELGGISITIEGGTLKEGEITGIPYLCKNENGDTEFKFLPYYIVKRIQDAERALNRCENDTDSVYRILEGEENKYKNDELSFEEKIEMIQTGKVTPVVIFFDEINRTDISVFRELMNVILTRSVNGYRFPWWVFIMAAMNPASQNSVYITNEMDPAQLDRFVKIKVKESSDEWLNYALDHNVDRSLMKFIANHASVLSESTQECEDTDKATPSPRGWNMVDMILKGRDKLDIIMSSHKEIEQKESDIRAIVSAKVGNEAAIMYFTSLNDSSRLILAEDLFNTSKSVILKEYKEIISKQSTARSSITTKSIVKYLTENVGELVNDSERLSRTNAILKQYSSLLDDSSRLLFAISVSNAKAENGKEIFSYFYEIFDEDLIELLQANNLNEIIISEGA